ncbi:MAG: mandelate racemase/muconate lactonizing enzyme family protein [Caldilineaceae bacterium]|nr:mandelate racemase/muconate lactonizing enzyme family protein [Caldilineaceae bacterium]
MRPRITDVRLLQLRTLQQIGTLEPAWDLGGRMVITTGGGFVTEIHTDTGVIGIGPGFATNLLSVVRRILIGTDPFDVEQHAAALRYYALGLPYQGAAGVDVALWDLIGKLCNQPLYKLWGSGKDKVAAYASTVILSTPEKRAGFAAQLADEGWQAVKLRIHHATIQEDIRTVELVRAAVGDRMEIMVDANQAQSAGQWQPGVRWDFRRALESARALDQLGCYWLEEPLPRFAFADLARINAAVAMPIAGGENNRNLHEFIQMLDANVYDILQPEGMVIIGITELRKVYTLGAAHDKQIVPHHGGRGLGTVAHLHLVAAWANAPYIELLHEPPIGDYRHGFAILQEPPVVDAQGYIAMPQGPGLGVELNYDLVEQVISE